MQAAKPAIDTPPPANTTKMCKHDSEVYVYLTVTALQPVTETAVIMKKGEEERE